MKIDFYLRFRTQFGQQIFITGNHDILGNNDWNDPLPMNFLSEDYWHLSVEIDFIGEQLHYRYIFRNENGEVLVDGEKQRVLPLAGNDLVVIDSWNYAGDYMNAFYTAPFQKVLLKEKKSLKLKVPSFHTHQFKVKAPLLKENEAIFITGNVDCLNSWELKEPLLLQKEDDWYTIKIDLSAIRFPVAYKYGIYDLENDKFVRYEQGDNRIVHFNENGPRQTIIHDGFLRIPDIRWRGTGVAIPVFSLRTKDSFGIGEFTDIKLLADWAGEVGIKLIQLLPVNDTTASYTWKDSYPYAAISAFALHPIYINLQEVAGKKNADIVRLLTKKKKQLNELAEIDYETVLNFKINTLRELYELDKKSFLKEEEFTSFFQTNSHWLKAYAAFCVLRDKYGTSDYEKWRTNAVYQQDEIDSLTAPKSKQYRQIAFWYFVQYHLHLQLKSAVKYAHKKGLVIKGDIPIGIYRYGCDAWMAPQLYNMDQQAGAPPDDFAVKGQNWGFPTYNWKKMQEDHFEWWRLRFEQMSYYFDAFRIDHILGFFRIWSIPVNSVDGIMGRFVPALPIDCKDFAENGIWFDYDRFCKPFINEEILQSLFGNEVEFVKTSFLQQNEKGGWELQDAFDTQKKVASFFENQDDTAENTSIKESLLYLIANVILFEEPNSGKQKFHFRISMERTSSFQWLDEYLKHKLRDLYNHYFYHRHDQFWKEEALRKLPALKEATNMLICGEDLGMVPHCVPEVMNQLGILSLEIQRMPKNPHTEFFNPKDAPYLSVISPSTHDMSTIRAWWEEDRIKTQRFFNSTLEEHGEAPAHCEPWVNRAIVMQHLYSPAMWSIFQLQDLLGISENLRREDANEERINVPANACHYWRYRMHIPLEQLIKEKEFNRQLKELIQNSGR